MDPTLLLVGGGLLALVLGAEIFSDDDDDNDNDNDDGEIVDPPTDDKTDDQVTITNDVATGTAESDEIVQPADTASVDYFDEAHGLAGHDTIEMDHGGSAYGGAGADKIDVEDRYLGDPSAHVRATIDGGSGNDDIDVSPYAADILGGTGHDTIDYSEDNIDWQLGSTINAGSGNDVVDADIEVGADNEPLTVTLGSGEDKIHVELDMDDLGVSTNHDEQAVSHYKGQDTPVVITDFDPAEDSLTIELDPEAENFSVGGQQVDLRYDRWEAREENDDTFVEIYYTTPDGEEVSNTIHLQNVTGLPANAVKFITT